jgi:archaeal flagellin FlaB
MKKKADMGIGTLILFIAMILVAAIAAGVLIQTASSLQNKALLTGERSKSQVSTNIMPIILHAEDGTDVDGVDEFYLKVRLAPGSDSVNFDDLLLSFSLKDLSLDMTYNDSNNCSVLSTSNGLYFAIDYLIDGGNPTIGYLQSGDVVLLCFQSTRKINEDESLILRLIPKVGSPTVIESALPDIMTEQRIVIYP